MKSDGFPRSIVRVASVLQCFSPQELELTAADIAQKVKMPKTTTYRMLSTLAKVGLLEQNSKTGKYSIGPELYVLGNLYLGRLDALKAAEPVIKTMNDLTGEVTNLAMLDDKGNITFVMREESRHGLGLRVGGHVGLTSPAYAHALGKALLSELTEAEIDSLYPQETLKPLTKKTVATRTELKRELQEVRKAGVAFNSEQSYEGVEAAASVIRDVRGMAVAATAIGVPMVRMNKDRREKLAKLIKMGASLISYRLGYHDTVNPIRDIQEIRSWWEQNQLASTLETAKDTGKGST